MFKSFIKGPSLRVQGEPRSDHSDDRTHRAIPARAGRTPGIASSGRQKKGHPCACRENLHNDKQCRGIVGPSLRVQGEQEIEEGPVLGVRAIPARAGRTECQSIDPLCGPGHPCACRENSYDPTTGQWTDGPSLRVQGEPMASTMPAQVVRAIPARAGRTS